MCMSGGGLHVYVGGSACVCGGFRMCTYVCGKSACICMCVRAGSATADARYLASSQEPDEDLQSLLSYEEVCQKAIPDLKVS